MTNASGGLNENIYPTLVFRDEAAFSIPKYIREVGYIQSLDLYINSIAWNQYENGKALPPIQFYGYVQLVLQDACSIEVPIKYPRQRIWSYRVESALNQWRDIHTWNTAMEQWELFFFGLFTAGAEEAPPAPAIEYPNTNFIESPLREVFIKCPNGTQFEVEITQWEPIPFVGYRNKSFDGKSGQVDGDKDNGLPSDGIQPRRNPSNNPFLGMPEPTFISLDNPFYSSTGKLFDSSLPDLEDVPAASDSEGFYLELTFIICSNYQTTLTPLPQRPVRLVRYEPCRNNSVVEVFGQDGTRDPVNCGGIIDTQWRITNTSYSVTSPILNGSSINGVLKYGLLPSETFITEL